jgi:hypothetical protein
MTQLAKIPRASLLPPMENPRETVPFQLLRAAALAERAKDSASADNFRRLAAVEFRTRATFYHGGNK